MAFQHPQQRPQLARQSSPPKASSTIQAPNVASHIRQRTVGDSQDWILFSPAQHEGQSHSSQTARTSTQPSLFGGSLETHVQSQPPEGRADVERSGGASEVDDDEGADLDSLDDGLHAFHHHPFSAPSQHLDQSGGTVLPTHDGFGTFPSSAGVQEHLWQFERYNPQRRRHVRNRSSVQKQLDAMEEEHDTDLEDDRTARIEKWRAEQSRAVLDEIEKETRRRRRKISRMAGTGASADVRTLVRENASASSRPGHKEATPQQPKPPVEGATEQSRSESFWQRITRRVIQDLIGLDENILSIIFGEALPEDATPTPTQSSPIAAAVVAEQHAERSVAFHDSGYSWEIKFLQHIAEELGILVHNLTEHDGRAFSSYVRRRNMAERTSSSPRGISPRQPSTRQRRQSQLNREQAAPIEQSSTPTFSQPPLSASDVVDTSLWGIEEESEDLRPSPKDDLLSSQQERDYWQRDIDINMIFSYLKRCFSSQPPPSHSSAPASVPTGPLPASWTTNHTTTSALGTSPESLRRAELIRRQHPLVSRAAERAAAQNTRRDSLLRRHQMQSLSLKRPGGSSSCASQSTKRSRHSRDGESSRHYWDFGESIGSVGSGPVTSAVGGWGEV